MCSRTVPNVMNSSVCFVFKVNDKFAAVHVWVYIHQVIYEVVQLYLLNVSNGFAVVSFVVSMVNRHMRLRNVMFVCLLFRSPLSRTI